MNFLRTDPGGVCAGGKREEPRPRVRRPLPTSLKADKLSLVILILHLFMLWRFGHAALLRKPGPIRLSLTVSCSPPVEQWGAARVRPKKLSGVHLLLRFMLFSGCRRTNFRAQNRPSRFNNRSRQQARKRRSSISADTLNRKTAEIFSRPTL